MWWQWCNLLRQTRFHDCRIVQWTNQVCVVRYLFLFEEYGPYVITVHREFCYVTFHKSKLTTVSTRSQVDSDIHVIMRSFFVYAGIYLLYVNTLCNIRFPREFDRASTKVLILSVRIQGSSGHTIGSWGEKNTGQQLRRHQHFPVILRAKMIRTILYCTLHTH